MSGGASAVRAASTEINPVLAPWQTPFGLPPYQQFEAAHFEPALREAMAGHRVELAALTAQAAAPDFDNTVAALDRCGSTLDRVMAVFYGLTASATSPALQAVQRAMAGPVSAHFSAVYTDHSLFERVHALYVRRQELALSPEQLRMLERQHLDFVRAGVQLPPAQRKRYAQIMEAQAQLMTRFAQNVLFDESSWQLALEGEADLAGLPDFVRASAQQAAADRGLPGHVVTLSRSLVVPFLTFSERADLRQRAWAAWVGRGENPGEHDNREVARDLLRLRREQAELMGHSCFADHALADTMAQSRQAVQGLLGEVWPRALKALAAEQQMLEALRLAHGVGPGPIEPWDWRYWAEKVRRERFAIDDAEVKPYFELQRVVEAAFDCAGRLFGLQFAARADLPVYHPDVRAYEVRNAKGALVGIFMQDNFARPAKRSGAWMSALRWQSRNGLPGQEPELPVIFNNNNFAKGAPGEPTLLSLDDARTLFHEFGHGLHGLLSNVTFKRLSGTQVLRDFVELPSQIFEHWITEPEVLQRHARHWKTDEPIPLDLMQRMQRARQFNQGYETVRYTASAMVDMAVHSLPDPEPPADLCAFEADFLRAQGLPHGVGMNHRLVHFQHLFASSGYAAGYYVYLWAEVLDADGYDAFVEAGSPFDAQVAQRLLKHIYSAGNSVEPGQAYQDFRGRPASVQPLLRKRGLLQAEPA
jgi:peptidyl-dipeptidase Dcp